MIEQLYKLFANTYGLYTKTQSCHWNVEGAHFSSLHKLFEEQYEELSEAVDEIAEKIVMRNVKIKASWQDLAKASTISAIAGEAPWESMVEALMADNIAICKMIEGCRQAAAEAKDEVIVDFMNARAAQHQKNIWMLKATLAS